MPPPALVDTHCHLNFSRYDGDRAAVLQRARAAGAGRIIIPAIDIASAEAALALAAEHTGLYVAVGIHPNSSQDFRPAAIATLQALAAAKSVVAIGEIGLDYYRQRVPKAPQQSALARQLALAAELGLPVILHNRDAGDDLLALLEDWAPSAPPSLQGRLGVLHSFSASANIARRALGLGFYLGFTGPLTFKKAAGLRTIAQETPRDRLLIDQDAPCLGPAPRRGKRNEPADLPYINAKLAELQGLSAAAMARQTTANAERLFALPPLA